MDAVRLESYSKVLADTFPDDRDILQVLSDLVRSSREDYEAKFPVLGDFVGMVKTARWRRQEAAAAVQRAKDEEDERRYRLEHPEAFVTWKELMSEMAQRKAAKVAK